MNKPLQRIELKEKAYKTIIAVVEMPIYRKHDLLLDHAESIIYSRITVDPSGKYIDTAIQHTIHDSSAKETFEVEIEYDMQFDSSSPDYWLGRGRYKSSGDEFLGIVERLQVFLTKLYDEELVEKIERDRCKDSWHSKNRETAREWVEPYCPSCSALYETPAEEKEQCSDPWHLLLSNHPDKTPYCRQCLESCVSDLIEDREVG